MFNGCIFECITELMIYFKHIQRLFFLSKLLPKEVLNCRVWTRIEQGEIL